MVVFTSNNDAAAIWQNGLSATEGSFRDVKRLKGVGHSVVDGSYFCPSTIGNCQIVDARASRITASIRLCWTPKEEDLSIREWQGMNRDHTRIAHHLEAAVGR